MTLTGPVVWRVIAPIMWLVSACKGQEIESNLNRFYALRTQYNTEYGRLKHELSQLPARITYLRQVVKGYEQACTRLEAVQDGEVSSV